MNAQLSIEAEPQNLSTNYWLVFCSCNTSVTCSEMTASEVETGRTAMDCKARARSSPGGWPNRIPTSVLSIGGFKFVGVFQALDGFCPTPLVYCAQKDRKDRNNRRSTERTT